jgi:hypothetical protein
VRSGQPFSSHYFSRIARRLLPALFIAIVAAASATCGGSTTVETVVGPDGVRCQTTLAAQPTTVVPDGGNVSVNVTAARDCTWSATTDASWMQLSATSGQGDGTVSVTVARNDQPAARTGGVVINNQRVSINQQPMPCTYDLRASVSRLGRPGGRGNVSVQTANGCSWTASSSAEWLRLSSPTGSGEGTVGFEVLENNGAPREATIAVAGQSVTISQDGIGPPPPSTCNATITPPTISALAAGGTHNASLSIGGSCNWNATSSVSWVTFGSASSGQGSTSLTLVVARNTGAARSATVSVAQQVVTINQAAAPACTFSLDPRTASFNAQGGDGTVRVGTQDGCQWNTTGGADWIRVTSGSGTNNGQVTYTVSSNASTSSRSATLTIGGQAHSVSQQGAAPPACTFTLDPQSRNFPANGGDQTVRVDTQPSCQWTPSGAPAWVTVNGGTTTGPGSFSYSAQANSGASARNGSITVGAQSHQITQDAGTAACTYSVSATPQNFGAGGGGGSLTVTTQTGCAWTASAGASWITGGPWSGSGGTQSVNFAVDANTGGSRQAPITLNTGQSVNITQDAQAQTCTYSISANPQNFGAGGGGGQFTVTTSQPTCAWTASAGASWVTGGPWSGTGTGTMNLSVQANQGSQRQTTISLNSGQSASITQDAVAQTCTFQLSPGSQNFPAGGGSNSFTVTTQAGCTWSASSGAGWVAVTSTTATSVSYSVAANGATSSRQTTITVGNQSFTVTQDAAAPTCTYSVSANPSNFVAGGGGGSFTVTAPTGCAWTASAGAAWVTGGPWSGSGNGSGNFSVQANTGVARQTSIALNTGPSTGITQDAGTTTQVESRRQP